MLFAIVLLDASLIGANCVGLSTTYALGDSMGKPHSLHWKITEAPLFYGSYAVLLGVSAAVAFSPDHVLGLITQGVQALAGVLLPSATVFLVLLCNDRPVMGPWVNTFRQNAIAWMIVWSLVVLSLMLTAVTFYPNLSTATLATGLGFGVALGLLGAAIIFAVGWHDGAAQGRGHRAVRCAGLRPGGRTRATPEADPCRTQSFHKRGPRTLDHTGTGDRWSGQPYRRCVGPGC